MRNQSYIPVNVLLECLHTQSYAPPPQNGDVLYCRRCADYRPVIADVLNWHAKCSQCHMGRYYGANESEARRCATRHVHRFSHVVEVAPYAGAEPELVGNDLVTIQGVKG